MATTMAKKAAKKKANKAKPRRQPTKADASKGGGNTLASLIVPYYREHFGTDVPAREHVADGLKRLARMCEPRPAGALAEDPRNLARWLSNAAYCAEEGGSLAKRERELVNDFCLRVLDAYKFRQPLSAATAADMRETAEDLSKPSGGGATHAPDFTSVDWFGTLYHFAKGQQAEAVRVLWEAWTNGGHGVGQETVAERIASSATSFRLAHVFRDHPAWGTMIQSAGKGIFRLVRPEK